MSYLVLARKYRPQTFADVVGQQEITEKLKAALSSNRTAHAYLFCGPRGVGKTTCARILAKELNKDVAADGLSFDLGMQTALDIIEIDGASNNSVEDIRTLRENVQLMPMGGGVKVYIIDEVHMLSTAAFNALLKTLEEPPAHVKFVFATTDPNKLPLTVVSRCQRFDFRRIPIEQMAGYLKEVCQKEQITADEDALFSIAKASQGSMRDALSVLDQLSSVASGKVDLNEVNSMLGVVETERLFELAGAILRKDCSSALKVLNGIADKGKDIKQLSSDLVVFFRNLMVMKAGGRDLQDLIDYSVAYKKMLYELSLSVSMKEIIGNIDILVAVQETTRIIEMPQLALEIALAKIVISGSSIAPVSAVPVSGNQTSASSAAVKLPVAAKPVPGIILNNKGSVSIEPIVFDRNAEPETPIAASAVSLDIISRDWNTFTHAVCQESMSVGTYLLEGHPVKFDGRKLAVAFSHEHEFHKEFLDSPGNLKIMSASFQEVFKQEAVIDLIIMSDADAGKLASAVNEALAMFGGEVVNEWDSGDGLSKSH
ncbi:MAG: DNA polymerase III subunit gamma/tau [Candidatus Omnitrophica bacterium]|nr:DNA polymerase III subunit gamma/tau [Candidatus Omnitrophota bacterium]